MLPASADPVLVPPSVAPSVPARGRVAPDVARAWERLRLAVPALGARVRVVGAGEEMAAAGDDGESWWRVKDLAASPELTAALVEGQARRIELAHGARPSPHVAASRALHDYCWSAALLMSGPWYLHAAVPRLLRSDVQVHLASGALAVAAPEQLVAGEPDSALRLAVSDHFGAVLEAFAPHLRRGPRALWGTVADDLVSGVWHLGRELGEEQAAAAAATRLLPHRIGPFPAGAQFRRLPAAGGPAGEGHLTRTRIACCLYYAVEPDQACLTCPRTPDAERARRLAQG